MTEAVTLGLAERPLCTDTRPAAVKELAARLAALSRAALHAGFAYGSAAATPAWLLPTRCNTIRNNGTSQ
jgi:hypothetical protein